MDWGTVAVVGTQILGSMVGGKAKRNAARAQQAVDEANARAQNLLNQTNADAANKVRTANNGFAVAQASLSNLSRSLANQGKLRTGGEAVNALGTNLARLQDQAVTGSLNQRIAAAEQLGAVRAMSAASGAGGTSAAMLHQTMQLSHARLDTTRQQNMQYQTFDMLAQRAGLMGSMAESIDQGQSFAPLDYGINTAPLAQAPFRAPPQGPWMDFLTGGGAALIGQAVGNFGGQNGWGQGLMDSAGSLFSSSPAASSTPAYTAAPAQAFPVNTGKGLEAFTL